MLKKLDTISAEAKATQQLTSSTVKLSEEENAMKTTTLIMTVAITGALLATASVAKANAYLTLDSGGTIINVASSTDGVAYSGPVGSWTVDIATATSSGKLTVELADSTENSGKQTSGLEVIYSSGFYNTDGSYDFGASTSGSQTLASTASAYTGSMLYTSGVGGLGSLSQISGTISMPTHSFGADEFGTIGGSYYLTEVLTIGTIAPGSIGEFVHANLGETFTVTAVPDSGITLTMAGAVFMGLAGLRSKFGAKRS
jgi:hypothetical protein